MEDFRIAVAGIVATDSVLAAALLSTDHEINLLDPRPDLGDGLQKKRINISGEIKDLNSNFIFLCTKTFQLNRLLDELKVAIKPRTKIISTQNGLAQKIPLRKNSAMTQPSGCP